MADQTSGTNESMENKAPVDPWIEAFAALEPKTEEDTKEASNMGDDNNGGAVADTNGTSVQEVSDQDETVNSTASEGIVGGSGVDGGELDNQSGTAFEEVSGVTTESIEQFENDLNKSIRDQAVNDVAAEFIKRGVRNSNGALGATMDDPDICKRDSDGVPHFYNPETGREFVGDNPRRQAQEWVDDYNKELARVFNNTCAEYEQHLKEESAPRIAVMKFAPKYDALDDIRKGMFDNVIQDYEITDNDGKVIGYSCDLDKALSLVERQIEMIQNYAKQHQQQAVVKPEPTGPALDMKTSSGAIPNGNDAPPTSLAEAMERLQDAQLSKLKKN